MECDSGVAMMKRKIDVSDGINICDAKIVTGAVGDVDNGISSLVLLLVMTILEVVASGWWW